MALQVWMPLISDLTNNGLAKDAVYAQDNVGFGSSGRVGPTAAIGTSDETGVIYGDKNYLGYEGTVCFWIYVSDTCSNSIIFGFNGVGANVYNRKWSLFTYPTRNDLHSWGCMRDDESIHNGSFGVEGCFPDNTWTHVCVSHDMYYEYIYINGELVAGAKWSSSGTFTFDKNMHYLHFPKGYRFNDFRMYDECLDAKTIKEISRGMILHYPLGSVDGNTIGRNIAEESDPTNIKIYGWSTGLDNAVTAELIMENNEPSIRLTRNPDVSNADFKWSFINNQHIGRAKWEPSTWYTVSIDAKSNKTTWMNVLFRCPDFHDQIIDESKTVKINTRIIPNQWNRLVWIVYSVDPLPSNTAQSIYLHGMNGESDTYYEFKNLKIEKGITLTPYTPAPENCQSMFSDKSVVYDVSGFGNHGILYGKMGKIDESPRYDQSMLFNGTDTYITTPKSVKITDELSVSLWAYMDTWKSGSRIVSCTEAGGWNTESENNDENDHIQVGMMAAGKYMRGATSTVQWNSLSSGWHHFAFAFDGCTTRLYLDGEKIAENHFSDTKLPITYNANNTVFIGAEAGGDDVTPATTAAPFSGGINDFRIYASALSDDDILELYKSPVSFTKSGTLITQGEFKED